MQRYPVVDVVRYFGGETVVIDANEVFNDVKMAERAGKV